MPIYTEKAEKLVSWLRARKALSRESGVVIPQASIASSLINGSILSKATRKIGGGSQHTIYWLTEHGVRMAVALKRKCRECGCSEFNPCAGGCAWLEPDLCSTKACVESDSRKQAAKKRKAKKRGLR